MGYLLPEGVEWYTSSHIDTHKIQAVIREQKYIDELKPNLNINRAFTGIVDNNNYKKQYKEMFREELLAKKK